MRMRSCVRLILTALSIFLMGGIAGAQTAGDRPVLILADLSGSSQAKLGYFNSPEKDAVAWTTRAGALKDILTLFALSLPDDYCPVGIFEMRYLSGDENCYAPIVPPAAYQSRDLLMRVKADLITEIPVFNRRTALADGLRQLDEKILNPLGGQAVILMISDGEENMRCGKNKNIEPIDKQQIIRADAPVRDPLTEVRRLMQKYGANLTLHAIGLECGNPEDKNASAQEGLNLLRKMTTAADGRYFSGRELLQNQDMITDLYPLLCENGGLETVVQPGGEDPPPPAAGGEEP